AFIISAAMSGAMILAAFDVQAERMTLGDFVLMNAFMMQIFMPLNFLGFVYREMKGSMTNVERLFALLAEKPAVADRADAKPLHVAKGEIVFEAVDFAYQPA